ncbi:hypothetical protein KFU94_45485 [Chloroflexi bacterium TSY]|nr:hypothetical protein [Chloroflexi bacterium TSY]
MEEPKIHKCECKICIEQESPEIMENHHLMNLFMSRLDEQERRWYAAIEATKLGHGGRQKVSEITGLHVTLLSGKRKEMR